MIKLTKIYVFKIGILLRDGFDSVNNRSLLIVYCHHLFLKSKPFLNDIIFTVRYSLFEPGHEKTGL